MTNLRTNLIESRDAMNYPDALVQMRALLPIFRAPIQEAIRLRRLPNATCDDIRKSGLARILQPARYGGAEAPPRIDDRARPGRCRLRRDRLVSRAVPDPQLRDRAMPKAAQDAIWGDQPDALVSGILIPLLGKAKRVDGGARLTTAFVSGIAGADWCILSGMMENRGHNRKLFPCAHQPRVDFRQLVQHRTSGQRQ